MSELDTTRIIEEMRHRIEQLESLTGHYAPLRSVDASNANDYSQATPVIGTWYNLGAVSFTVPAGFWRISYKVVAQIGNASQAVGDYYGAVTLSTANNTESAPNFTQAFGAGNIKFLRCGLMLAADVTLASDTTFYLNMSVPATCSIIYFLGSVGRTRLTATW